MIRSGEMRHTLTVEQQATTQDSMGGQSTAWSTLLTVRGAIAPMTAAERISSQALATDVSHQITTRYHPAFIDPLANATRRIRYGSRIFAIRGTLNIDERNKVITFEASEGVARAG